MLLVFGSALDEAEAPGVRGHEALPPSLGDGVIMARNPAPCLSPDQFMFRGAFRCCRTTILFCRLAIFPSVNDESRGEGVHPVAPPLGHHQLSWPVPREVPHGRWMTSNRCGAFPGCA